MNPFLIFLAVLPGLIICYLIFRMDKYEKEPKALLVICFLLGMFITVPARYIESLEYTLGWSNMAVWWQLVLVAFVLVALTEELVKWLSLLVPFNSHHFNEPFDGIIYAVMIGMGFATLENIIYADRFGLGTTLFRAFTAVPAHASFAVIMGYFVGLAKINPDQKIQLWFKGLGSAVLLHGIYDFFILQEYYDGLMILATLTLAVGIYISILLIRRAQSISPFKGSKAEEEQAPLASS